MACAWSQPTRRRLLIKLYEASDTSNGSARKQPTR